MGTRARYFFFEAAREISEKWNFFVNRCVPKNFQWENFSGQVPTESLRTQDSENVQGGFFNWPAPPHARLNRALVQGLAVHEEEGAS